MVLLDAIDIPSRGGVVRIHRNIGFIYNNIACRIEVEGKTPKLCRDIIVESHLIIRLLKNTSIR